MFIEEVFRQLAGNSDGLKVLDLCGAPGGKSTHISSLIGNRGLLVANEVIRSRAVVLAENITKWGVSNTIVTGSDPAAFAHLPGYFDIVLVDAPCSGEGMFSDSDVRKEWSPGNAVLCSERQKRIMMDVWPALKENGFLIYSTCTFNPDENEENVKWLLRSKNGEAISIDTSGYKMITEIDKDGIPGYGFYPGKIRGEGFFLSVIRKKEKCDSHTGRVKNRKSFIPGSEEIRKASELSDFLPESLIKITDDIIAVPCSLNDYILLSEKLRVVKHGTKIYSSKSKDIIPSHELALSIRSGISVDNTLNLGYDHALRYLRRENVRVTGISPGWILVQYKGVNIGFLKNIGNRMNNYYPVEWRIKLRSSDNEEDKIIKWIHTSVD